jgi:hypothetical protein
VQGVVALQCAAQTASSEVRIEVSGTIAPRCGVTAVAVPVGGVDLSRQGQAAFAFPVDCNAPFAYTVVSENGGFALEGAPKTGSTALSSRIPYSVDIAIPLDGGAIVDRCESVNIVEGKRACPLSTSGRLVAIAKTGTVGVSWRKPQTGLLSGTYRDRLTLAFTLLP